MLGKPPHRMEVVVHARWGGFLVAVRKRYKRDSLVVPPRGGRLLTAVG
jgi:hypothetical protein